MKKMLIGGLLSTVALARNPLGRFLVDESTRAFNLLKAVQDGRKYMAENPTRFKSDGTPIILKEPSYSDMTPLNILPAGFQPSPHGHNFLPGKDKNEPATAVQPTSAPSDSQVALGKQAAEDAAASAKQKNKDAKKAAAASDSQKALGKKAAEDAAAVGKQKNKPALVRQANIDLKPFKKPATVTDTPAEPTAETTAAPEVQNESKFRQAVNKVSSVAASAKDTAVGALKSVTNTATGAVSSAIGWVKGTNKPEVQKEPTELEQVKLRKVEPTPKPVVEKVKTELEKVQLKKVGPVVRPEIKPTTPEWQNIKLKKLKLI